MYHFDNNNKDEPSPSPNENNNNNSYDPLYSHSFHSSSFHHQSHSLDDNFSFLNFDSNAAPPSSFLQDGVVGSLGHDSLLGQHWNGMYDSSFTDNPQQHDQFFLPLQQQQQHQDQLQLQQHDTHQKQSRPTGDNSELFLSLTEQEQQAILMTEPNFLRQQHLLHDNKMKMEMEEHDQAGTPPMRSNLSAMLGQPTATTTNNHSVSLSSSIPSSHNAMSAASPNDIFQSSHQHPTMSHSMGFDNGQHHHQQQQQPYSTSASAIYATTVKRASSSNTKPRKETNRRSQQGIGSRGNNRANPIPINAGSSSTSGAVTKHSSSVPTEIDHQRRFNELQARFRVNYARKSGASGNPATLSTSSSQHSVSNGFGNRTSRDFMTGSNGATVFGSSVPTSMEKRLLESVYGGGGGGNDTENETIRFSTNMKSPSTTATTAGVAIPKKTNTNNTNFGTSSSSSSSNSMKHASSFPSRTMPIQIQRVQRANTSQPVDADQRQKRLDDQLVKANFDDITVSELKEMLRQRGKPATGKKAILLQRLADERDNINAVRSGKILHRHSQPPPSLSSSSLENRHSMDATYSSSSPLLESPSSVPNSSMFLSSSPGSTTLSLNRSIANMHIGSPPPPSQQHIRRFSPYNAPPTGSSPRLGSSPKMQIQKQAYSSSMPNSYLSSPPLLLNNNSINSNEGIVSFNDGISPMTPSMNSATTTRTKRPYQGWTGRQQKSYAPFTSSALATPDHDNVKDPFDVMAKDTANRNVQQQEQQQPLYDNLYQSQQDHHGIKDETMEWMNQSLTGNPSLNGILQALPEGVSIDQFMVWLNENDQFNVDPMKMDVTGMIPMDINQASYSDGPLYDDLPPGGPDYT